MEEQQQSIQQRGETSPAVRSAPMTTTEKATYAAIAGVPSLLILELLNAKGPGFAIAGFIGYGVWHFSDRIRDARGDHKQKTATPLSKRAQSALYWLGTGHAMPEASEQNARSEEDEGAIETTLTRATAPASKSEQQGESWDNEDDELPPPSPVGTDRFTFSQVLSRFTPSMEHIFLGLLPDGTPVTVPAEDLCHVALAGNTGGGKSSLLRMIMAQLCKAGAHVLLLNPHYTPYDRKHDEDWTPYLPYLEKPALECARFENIKIYLQWMAETLLPRRIERVRAGRLAGKPYFIILDELPDVIAKIKEAPEYIGEILRQGRKYDIYLIVASQDFLAKTVSGEEGGAVRKMYRTALYVGGDPTTAKVLLNMAPKDIPENALGKGTIMLRCTSTKQAVMARVPYLDNKALYTLLGPSTFVIPDENEQDESFPAISQSEPTRKLENDPGNSMEMSQEAAPSNIISDVFPFPGKEIGGISRSDIPVSDEKLEMIRQMKERNYQDTEIVALVKLRGRKYPVYQQCLVYLGYKLAKEG